MHLPTSYKNLKMKEHVTNLKWIVYVIWTVLKNAKMLSVTLRSRQPNTTSTSCRNGQQSFPRLLTSKSLISVEPVTPMKPLRSICSRPETNSPDSTRSKSASHARWISRWQRKQTWHAYQKKNSLAITSWLQLCTLWKASHALVMKTSLLPVENKTTCVSPISHSSTETMTCERKSTPSSTTAACSRIRTKT